MKQKAKPAQPAQRKLSRDPSITSANRARRMAKDARLKAAAAEKRAARTAAALTKAKADYEHDTALFHAVEAYGVAAEIHHLIHRPE